MDLKSGKYLLHAFIGLLVLLGVAMAALGCSPYVRSLRGWSIAGPVVVWAIVFL